MNCDNVKEAVNNIIDGNNIECCDKDLFRHLAECEDCSGFFKMVSGCKKEIKKQHLVFPSDLNERVFDIIKQKQAAKNNTFSFKRYWKKEMHIPLPIGIAFSMILIILGVMVFNNFYASDNTLFSNNVYRGLQKTPEKIIILYGMPEIIIKDMPFENTGGIINENFKLQ